MATPDAPHLRYILLGASNLTFGFPHIVNLLQGAQRTEIFAAHGHGRSFCQWSYVLHRGLPPIPKCGIWDALKAQPECERTVALVTDAGNDLLYGWKPQDIVNNVRVCYQRLAEHHARIIYVRLPVDQLVRLSAARYQIVKRLLFPGPTMPWGQMRPQIPELDELLVSTAGEAGATIIDALPEWYGFDPIHIRGRHRAAAWQHIFADANLKEASPPRPSWSQSIRLWRRAPQERTLFSKLRQQQQPCWTLPNGSTLWLY